MLVVVVMLRRLIIGRCITMICIVIVLVAVRVVVGMRGVIERIAKCGRSKVCRIESEHYGKHECENSAHGADYTIPQFRVKIGVRCLLPPWVAHGFVGHFVRGSLNHGI